MSDKWAWDLLRCSSTKPVNDSGAIERLVTNRLVKARAALDASGAIERAAQQIFEGEYGGLSDLLRRPR